MDYVFNAKVNGQEISADNEATFTLLCAAAMKATKSPRASKKISKRTSPSTFLEKAIDITPDEAKKALDIYAQWSNNDAALKAKFIELSINPYSFKNCAKSLKASPKAAAFLRS